MEQAEELKRKIDNARDLHSVVKTMKTLAAVNIRSYEKAVRSLEIYFRTVELGFRILLNQSTANFVNKLVEAKQKGKTLIIVFGSERGMSGQFNQKAAAFTHELIESRNFKADDFRLLPVGDRIISRLEDKYLKDSKAFPIAGSLKEIIPILQKLLVHVESLNRKRNIKSIIVIHNSPSSAASYEPHYKNLLPLDKKWLHEIRSREWDSNSLPFYRTDWTELYSALLREYFFTVLYRAFAESLAAENAGRLASMQAAEKNIEEHLEELNSKFNTQRQNAITNELMDIVSGFEALKGEHNGKDD